MDSKEKKDSIYNKILETNKPIMKNFQIFSPINRINPKKSNFIKNKIDFNLKSNKIRNFEFLKENSRYSLNNGNEKETFQSLYELNIDKNILEGIYNNKSILIRNMKLKDKHGDGLIPKFDFLSTFMNTNCHYKLRIELIDKIINIYLSNDPNVLMVYYLHIINALYNDIKLILNNNNTIFQMNKYFSPNNKIHTSQHFFSRNSRHININNNITNHSLNKTRYLPNIKEFDIKEIINKINNISYELFNYSKRIVSFLELKSILEKNMIFLNKIQIIQLLKFLKIENPNCFAFDEFMNKIKINSDCLNKTIISHRSFRLNNREKEKYLQSQTINSGFFKNKNRKIAYLKYNVLSKSQNLNTSNNIKLYKAQDKKINIENDKNEEFKNSFIIEKNLQKDEIIINSINKIQDKIFEEQYKMDLITEYFDKLLSYNTFREENVINVEEFEKALNYENFNLSKEEIALLFSYIDSKKDGFIDRNEFIEAIKKIPHPISTIQNYILKNNLSIEDLAYKMEIDLYRNPINDIFNTKIQQNQFIEKLRFINPNFRRDFCISLFKSISKGENETNLKKIFEIFNVKNEDSYKDLYNNRNEISNNFTQIITSNITYFNLRDKLNSLDYYKTGILPLNIMNKAIQELSKGKISDIDLLHFLRMYKLIDKENKVYFRELINIIFLKGDTFSELWNKCLETFMHFLKSECSNDVYIFLAKLNNLENNTSMKKIIDNNKLYEFFKTRNNFINFPSSVIKKFDYDNDGKISQDDLKNIIINYVDKHFFINKDEIKENVKISNEKKEFNENKKLYIYLKQILYKNNFTLNNFFFYLDENKDTYIDKNEFISQLYSLPYFNKNKFSQDKIEQFFDFLDEFKNDKVDLNIFRNKLNIFDDNIKLNNEKINQGNMRTEKIILYEIKRLLLTNSNMTDTELFTLLDQDNDGIVSKEDLKSFCISILKINENELTFDKLLNLITCISFNKEENLNLSDIQNLMKDIQRDDLNKYINIINNYNNETINIKNIDNDWIKEIIDVIGFYISQEFDSNVKEFYNSLNKTNLTNKGQGLSFQNILDFFEENYLLIESFHMNNDKYMTLFNYLSNKNKFITYDDLSKIFNNYDFYGWMHKYIKNFLKDNFHSSSDAFKYFHKVKTFENETPTSNEENRKNDYITKKEYFDGILSLFKNKFKANIISNYYNKFIKKQISSNNSDDMNNINYYEFNSIYFNGNREEKLSSKREVKIKKLNQNMKNSFFSTLKSPFRIKLNKKLRTPFDLDSLNKMKKLINSSKIDFKIEFQKFMNKTNGRANIFEIKNMIKGLGLGLTNIEIEDIMHKSGLLSEGYINLIEFYNYITSENNQTTVYKKNITEALKELKQLIIKYYTNPKLAFDMNDIYHKKLIDFETFKKIVLDIYKREERSFPPPPYSSIKSMYDYIDIRKDGIIDINEWNKTFCNIEGKLDIENDKNNNLKNWELSNDILDVYKLIARNHRIIEEKVKEQSITGDCTIIHADNLITVLKEVLPKVYLTHTQWRMIVSLGEEISLGLINYETFIKIIKLSSRISKSHIRI